jgi:hypothetical protein
VLSPRAPPLRIPETREVNVTWTLPSDAYTPLVSSAVLCLRAVSLPPVARDLGSRRFATLAIKVQLLHPSKPRTTISQQWVDSFPGDMCPPPVTRFHLSLGACCYATCQPRGPHLTDVPRVRTSPRCSTLRDFCSRKEILSTFEPPIRDTTRRF